MIASQNLAFAIVISAWMLAIAGCWAAIFIMGIVQIAIRMLSMVI
jgi:hypothetical protein